MQKNTKVSQNYDWSHAAEAHDIGKLFVKGAKHNLEDILDELRKQRVEEESPVFQAILKHHAEDNMQLYPDSYETFLVHLADILASQASRIPKQFREKVLKKFGVNHCVYKLWKGPLCNSDKPPLYNKYDILIKYLKEDPEGKEFLSTFREYLLQRAEDARKGANITSLYSHSVLSGKFFRILYKYYYDEIRKVKIDFSSKEDVRRKAEGILNRLPVVLVYLRIVPTQYIYRVKDLNIFRIIGDILSYFESKYRDHILYHGFDDILIIDLPRISIHRELIQKAHEYGFYVDVHALYATFQKGDRRILGIEPRKIARRFKDIKRGCNEGVKENCFEEIYCYPQLQERIDPPICDICQLRPATKMWVDEESGLIEYLCEQCYRVRAYPSGGLYKLAEWNEGTVAWIRVCLDVEALESALVKLYAKYLLELGIENAEKEVNEIDGKEGLVSPTLLQEFLWDYDNFVKAVGGIISSLFPEDNIEVIDKSFYILKVEKLSDIISLIENYNALLWKYFPKLVVLGDIEPVRFGISISHVKYPFHEHWRLLSNMRKGFLLHVYRRGIVETTYIELSATLRFYRSQEVVRRKQMLYRAIELAEYSKLLAEIELLKHLKYISKDVNLQLLRMLLELERR